MPYLPPFESWKSASQIAPNNGSLTVSFDYEMFMILIKSMLRAVPVDEEFYLSRYTDVAEAIQTGTYKNGREHFMENGYFEGRLPFPPELQEEWYLTQNPDVRDGISNGLITSAREHYLEHGYIEGRLPMP